MPGEKTSYNEPFDLIFAAKNIFFGFALTIVLLFIAAWISATVALPRAVTCLIVNVITYICIGFCGFRGAKKSGNRGILNGALYGLCYTAVLFLISCLARGGISFDSSSVVAAAICIGCGAAGGILGVNATSKKRRR